MSTPFLNGQGECGLSQWGNVRPTVIILSAMEEEEMEQLSFVAISRISDRISGERVRAIRSFRGFPEGGLPIRESYYVSHFNVQ